MSGIKEEEARLLQWASEREDNPLQELFYAPNEAESFFSAKNGNGYIMDYGFETPLELIRILKDLWEGDACQKQLLAATACITAAVFKQEPGFAEEGAPGQSGIEVPMFIYNF